MEDNELTKLLKKEIDKHIEFGVENVCAFHEDNVREIEAPLSSIMSGHGHKATIPDKILLNNELQEEELERYIKEIVPIKIRESYAWLLTQDGNSINYRNTISVFRNLIARRREGYEERKKHGKELSRVKRDAIKKAAFTKSLSPAQRKAYEEIKRMPK